MMDHTLITFQAHQISYPSAPTPQWAPWLARVIQNHQKQLGTLTYIFCTDAYLHQINLTHLQHDTFTDVITFDLSDHSDKLTGEIYISLERVKDNALHFQVPYLHELSRVILHGLLHLLGYQDHNATAQQAMRQKEEHYLATLSLPH